MSRPNQALKNLRGCVILIVLAFHSMLAYVAWAPDSQPPFNDPPYQWRAFPIVDGERWFGFDLFCALQDLYLITLMFFLSGFFLWPSLVRKGGGAFLYDRLLRLGLPYALAVGLLMPLAHYPVYLVTATDPSVTAYWQQLTALPFWPNGPPWFLLVLLVLDVAAASVYWCAPGLGDGLARLSAHSWLFVVSLLFVASAVAYVPLALAFTPWEWFYKGPFAFQLCRLLHYAVYFFAGAGLGAYGLERGLLAPDGILVRQWGRWLASAIASFALWLAIAGLTMANKGPPLAMQTLQALSFVIACVTICLSVLALFFRFANRPGPLPGLDFLSQNAYGLYLIHYVFVIWLQYLLLGIAIFAIFKWMIVLASTLLLSCAAIFAIRCIPALDRMIGPNRHAQLMRH
jgi:glucans biosynthesis protein C